MMVTKLKNIKNIWKTVIGLEIHAQINSKTKLFSVAPYKFNSPPNSNVAFFDMAMPGTLPIMNAKCINLAILAAAALKSEISYYSEFDRKHYFYCDMPAGYQITQNRYPIARNGKMCFLWQSLVGSKCFEDVRKSEARISEIHIEQDSGKSLHDYDQNISLIDLNRAGVGLLEVVTDCQFENGAEAVGFVKELRDVFVELGICTGQMENGEMRVDANVSVMLSDSKTLGERSEIKNINSLRGVLKAIEFESKRQIDLLESGKSVMNETRFYDSLTESTFSMRDKEKVQDYRYFPEPNLPPLRLHSICQMENNVCMHPHTCVPCITNRIKSYIYPNVKRQLLMSKFSMSLDETNTVLSESGMYDFILSVSEFAHNSESQQSWLRNSGALSLTLLLGTLRQRNLPFSSCSISAEKFAQVVTMVNNLEINKIKAQEVINAMLDSPDQTAEAIVTKRRLKQMNDPQEIEKIIKEFIERHPQALADYKSGNKRVIRFFQKKIMSESNDLVNYKILTDLIPQLLEDKP